MRYPPGERHGIGPGSGEEGNIGMGERRAVGSHARPSADRLAVME